MKKFLFPLLALLLTPVTMQAQDPDVSSGSPIDDEVGKASIIICDYEESEAGESPMKLRFEPSYRFRVTFKDKKNNIYSLKRPEEFLSPKALERRKRLKLKVDWYDLPVTPAYLSSLQEKGFRVHNVSKWNNTAVVEVADSARAAELEALAFVTEVKCVWRSPLEINTGDANGAYTIAAFHPNDEAILQNAEELRREEVTDTITDGLTNHYGYAEEQVYMLGVPEMHNAGFHGEGMTIAVIDGGFHNVDLLPCFKNCRILGTRNFVHPGFSVYIEPESHGTMVLSCIAANQPGALVGTAPEASFYLLQSEDGNSEQMVEEDNWCAAVEYADSLGVDVISTSLGYYRFDNDMNSHTYRELDGRTAINSRSASLAASRGLLVLNSAGNSGDEEWKKIGFPADATDILAVGAVRSDSVNTNFSSIGNSADGRIKPDVMAMGRACATVGPDGSLYRVNGTSFSCPILAGAVTCLWQAYPNLRPTDIIQAVCNAGDRADYPDNIFGHGIPNMWRAYELLKDMK